MPAGTGQSTAMRTMPPETDTVADAAASTNFAAAGFICPNTCESIASAILNGDVFAKPPSPSTSASAPSDGGTARYSGIATRE